MERRPRGRHAYNDVDGEPDPQSWVHGLEALAREPFFRRYKERVSQLLELRSGDVYLDVGGGPGADAVARGREAAVRPVMVDPSTTMCAAAWTRGLREVAMAEAGSLPFADRSFHACSADRVLQHVADAAGAVREMVRVTRSAGRVVLAEPDLDTQVVECADQELARRVLRFRTDHNRANGAVAHRLPALLAAAGAADVAVEGHVLVVRDPTAVENVMGLRTWAAVAAVAGALSGEEARRWPALLDEAAALGGFLYAVTIFLVRARVP